MHIIVEVHCIQSLGSLLLLTAFTCKPGSIYSLFPKLVMQRFSFSFFFLQKLSKFCNQIIVIQLHMMYYSSSLCVGVRMRSSSKRKRNANKHCTVLHDVCAKSILKHTGLNCMSVMIFALPYFKCDMFSAWVHELQCMLEGCQ